LSIFEVEGSFEQAATLQGVVFPFSKQAQSCPRVFAATAISFVGNERGWVDASALRSA
jgi:hypothetical protein